VPTSPPIHSSDLSTDHGLRWHLSARVINGMHNKDAVGFATARRFAPNRPYRVTFNGGVHGPGDNACCQAAMLPAHLRLLRAGDGVHGRSGREGPSAAAGRLEPALSRVRRGK
jgi:hypothetical protein